MTLAWEIIEPRLIDILRELPQHQGSQDHPFLRNPRNLSAVPQPATRSLVGAKSIRELRVASARQRIDLAPALLQ